jgi:hypothetical protein
MAVGVLGGHRQDGHRHVDLVILPRDYFTMDVEKIKNLESELTVVNGKVVYAAGRYRALAPQLPAVSPSPRVATDNRLPSLFADCKRWGQV